MTLTRKEAVPGAQQELAAFAQLLRTIDEEGWQEASRCAGWTVADVAAHVVGTVTDVVNGRIEGQGTEEVTNRQVVERRGRSPQELADELDGSLKAGADILDAIDDAAWAGPAPGGLAGTMGFAVEALWFDTYMHAEDIRAALGRTPDRGPGLRAAVSHVAGLLERDEWGPASLKLDGQAAFAVGKGEGRTITGDAHAFVLAATGRGDPATFDLDETVNIYR